MEAQPQSRLQDVGTRLRTASLDEMKRLKAVQRYNLQTFRRHPLQEISGSVGDLGTLLPIMIALAENESISLSSTLVFGGLANILTGLFFGIPLPVQPMKAIAAVVLSNKFDKAETASAGLFVAAIIGFFSVTGLLRWFTKKIPIPVIKGIQMGVGLSLIMYGGTLLIKSVNNFHDTGNAVVASFAFLALLWSPMFTRVPYALVLFVVGAFCVVSEIISGSHGRLQVFSIWKPYVLVPSWASFRTGAFYAGLGQVPLTTLNSIIAVAFLAADLLPDVQAPSVTSMGLSVTAINLVGCWFGSMPVCHGSGGLAAQYRFGARSGASIIFLGLVKLVLGLFAGDLALQIFRYFPGNLLSIMVIGAGLELVNVGETLNSARAPDLNISEDGNEAAENNHSDRKIIDLTDEEKKRRWVVMLTTIGGILAFRNDAIGFLAGMLCHLTFKAQDRWEPRRSTREGHIRLEDESDGQEPRGLP